MTFELEAWIHEWFKKVFVSFEKWHWKWHDMRLPRHFHQMQLRLVWVCWGQCHVLCCSDWSGSSSGDTCRLCKLDRSRWTWSLWRRRWWDGGETMHETSHPTMKCVKSTFSDQTINLACRSVFVAHYYRLIVTDCRCTSLPYDAFLFFI